MEIAASRSNGIKLVTGKALQRFAPGRICGAVTCATRLSRYNPATTCSQHRGWHPAGDSPPPARRRRRPRDAASAATGDQGTPDASTGDWIAWVMAERQ